MPIILVTQEAEIRRIEVPSQPRPALQDPIWKNPITKKGLVEWLKCRSYLSSSLSMAKKIRNETLSPH
jgi:hypothetical protein